MGFVEQEQTWPAGEGPRQGETAALTRRELAVYDVSQWAETEQVENLLVGGRLDSCGSGGEAQVLPDGEVVITGGVMTDETELATMAFAVLAEIVAEDFGRPGVEGDQPGEQPEQRGLARSVAA